MTRICACIVAVCGAALMLFGALASCGGDQNSIFNHSGVAVGYIDDIDVTFTFADPGGDDSGYRFDKSTFEYVVYTTNATVGDVVTLALAFDESKVQVSGKCEKTHDPSDSFDYGSCTNTQEIIIELDRVETIVSFTSRLSDGRSPTLVYTLRFMISESDASPRLLMPYTTSSLESQYLEFSYPLRKDVRRYTLDFPVENMGFKVGLRSGQTLFADMDDGNGSSQRSLTNLRFDVKHGKTIEVVTNSNSFAWSTDFAANQTNIITLGIVSPNDFATNVITIVLARKIYVPPGDQKYIQYTTTPYVWPSGITGKTAGALMQGNIREAKDTAASISGATTNFVTPVGTGTIWAKYPASGKEFLTGVVTLSEVFSYRLALATSTQNSYEISFFVEDGEDGILVSWILPEYEPASSPVAIGDIVTFKVSHIVSHYSMPVAVIDASSPRITKLGKVDSIFYREAPTDSGGYGPPDGLRSRGRVYRWGDGNKVPETAPETDYGQLRGTFEGLRGFGLPARVGGEDWLDMFCDEKPRYFYGPVIYIFTLDMMVINEPGQIHETDTGTR